MLLTFEQMEFLCNVAEEKGEFMVAKPNLSAEEKEKLRAIDEWNLLCEGKHLVENYMDICADGVIRKDHAAFSPGSTGSGGAQIELAADLNRLFRGILSDIHKELLKPGGWKKDGQNFRLFFDGTPISKGVIINFQKSQWNDASNLRFTINAGKKYAYFPDRIDPKFKEYHCDLCARKRPQALCPKYKSDQWWSLTSATDCAQLKDEIKQYLADYAIPWLVE